MGLTVCIQSRALIQLTKAMMILPNPRHKPLLLAGILSYSSPYIYIVLNLRSDMVANVNGNGKSFSTLNSNWFRLIKK